MGKKIQIPVVLFFATLLAIALELSRLRLSWDEPFQRFTAQ